jgi:ubiquinol-cytochrome c reductase cytochrome b subunit
MYVLPYGQMSLWGKLLAPNSEFIDNYLVIFIENISNICNYTVLSGLVNSKHTRIRAVKRIGPHNIDLLSILIGSLLGDAFAEKHGNGTRIAFYQEDSHSAYLLWFHHYIAQLGYCNGTRPKLTKRLGLKGKVRTVIRFKTFTYSSFNWIREGFYTNNIKRVPEFIEIYLTPIALAVWIMDDGAKVSSGLKLATNSFSFSDTEKLATILRKKYSLKTSVIKTGRLNQYNIYIGKSSIELLFNIVKPYLHKSMYYKFSCINIKDNAC